MKKISLLLIISLTSSLVSPIIALSEQKSRLIQLKESFNKNIKEILKCVKRDADCNQTIKKTIVIGSLIIVALTGIGVGIVIYKTVPKKRPSPSRKPIISLSEAIEKADKDPYAGEYLKDAVNSGAVVTSEQLDTIVRQLTDKTGQALMGINPQEFKQLLKNMPNIQNELLKNKDGGYLLHRMVIKTGYHDYIKAVLDVANEQGFINELLQLKDYKNRTPLQLTFEILQQPKTDIAWALEQTLFNLVEYGADLHEIDKKEAKKVYWYFDDLQTKHPEAIQKVKNWLEH